MTGVYKLEITETEADLKQLLRTQKTASDFERIQQTVAETRKPRRGYALQCD